MTAIRDAMARAAATKSDPNMQALATVLQEGTTKMAKADKGKAKKAKFETVEVHFAYHSETTGTHKYAECTEEGGDIDKADLMVGTLYLKKRAVPGKPPARLKVTIEKVKSDA